jgi:hypothetical protein
MYSNNLTPLYKPLRRMYDGPIEADSTFETLDEAKLYAASIPSYDGQLISVTSGEGLGLYMVIQGGLYKIPLVQQVENLINDNQHVPVVKISKKPDNTIQMLDDGLYVKKVEVPVVPPPQPPQPPDPGQVIPPATGSGIKKYTKNIGDGIRNEIVVTHNLNTRDIMVNVWTNTMPPQYMVCDIIILDENMIQLLFEETPVPDQYRVVVMG